MSRTSCALGVLAATLALAACPSASAPALRSPTASPADRALRIRIAQAEARRGAGLDELGELVAGGTPAERVLALRGLGRIGGSRALAVLRGALADPNPSVVVAAASAIGVAALLDEPEPSAELTGALVAALERVPAADLPPMIEAIGRAGDASAESVLRRYLDPATPVAQAEAAALAIARFGRRKLELTAEVRRALVELAATSGVAGHAATYALAREHRAPGLRLAPADGQRLTRVLITRLGDAAPETRAQAAAALARHELVRAAHPALAQALLDRDWRVALEAVRALTGEHGDDGGRDAVAAALVRRHAELDRGALAEAHVVIEGLRALGPHAKRPLVQTSVATLAMNAASSSRRADLGHAWIACLARATMMRAAAAPDLTGIDGCTLPDHLRLPIVGELITAKVGALSRRRAALGILISHPDARVRAAGLAALPALWGEGSEADHRGAITMLVGALGSADPILAGAAIEAAPKLYAVIGSGDRSSLDAAVLSRATSERDPELSASVLELVGSRALAAGVGACRAGLTGHPVRIKAARSCLRALGEAAPVPEVAAATPPAADLASVVGAHLRWTLATTRGEIEIELHPEVAPWAVAAIVELTERGFYDGLEVHRVVGNFVVQGGDPTMSGWGGPGFTLPAEPASLHDGAGFVAGGVGMADAGRDSAGSQWFVMHGRAAHLDGRYTWFGTVARGQAAVDALVIGDHVVRATITRGTPGPCGPTGACRPVH